MRGGEKQHLTLPLGSTDNRAVWVSAVTHGSKMQFKLCSCRGIFSSGGFPESYEVCPSVLKLQ